MEQEAEVAVNWLVKALKNNNSKEKFSKFELSMDNEISGLNKKLYLLKTDVSHLNLLRNKFKFTIRYYRYKVLSKILFGKKREHYKYKSKMLHEKVREIRKTEKQMLTT